MFDIKAYKRVVFDRIRFCKTSNNSRDVQCNYVGQLKQCRLAPGVEILISLFTNQRFVSRKN